MQKNGNNRAKFNIQNKTIRTRNKYNVSHLLFCLFAVAALALTI